ncbi:MAG: ribonuclease H-like domain-containing protein [Proteobacteria bacterium]|nr:ribonuclease H-like domain-containing protein [Pseudomonadota bacterium]MBU1232405.1 ribonuclease H-like domain-containing protein [Pseudomonadota bacterium]MBU1417192.1 ribonuclease H-like domain-containing protein [Pseudomonadota bacterium]MBU1453634.1 ribonuclease H-like domain-containing protein [Pseudomonadota bacterium]
MLTHSFIHLPGIGTKTEAKLWQAGVHSWDQWQATPPLRLPNSSLPELNRLLQCSIEELDKGPSFFSNRLPANEQWRIFSHFRERTAYLDIETTGLGPQAEITTIALYDGREIRCYINGYNLDDFARDIWDYEILVTYNGKSFDIPAIERWFHIKITQAHIDLRFILAKLGFKGGLKGCEKQLGITRGALDGVDGSFAVLLWHDYINNNNEKALETLLSYNIEDTVNLERLLVEVYNRNVLQTPFGEDLRLPHPVSPLIPYRPDFNSVQRIKRGLR